jgi:hypothetical protein
MPIERDRYRTDWDDFADKIKSAANWTCQGGGKPCRPCRESIEGFANRVFAPCSATWLDAMRHPQKFCLTVAHLDQNPANDEPENVLSIHESKSSKASSKYLRSSVQTAVETHTACAALFSFLAKVISFRIRSYNRIAIT